MIENCKSSTTHIYGENSKVINRELELDIFSDAKFGDKYVTRNGDIALYLCDCILVVEGTATPIYYNQRGCYWGGKDYDIIGKYNLWYRIKKYFKKWYI